MFAKVADALLSLVLHEGTISKRIYVIFHFTKKAPSSMQKEGRGEMNLEMNIETFNPSKRCLSEENSF